MEQKVIFTDSKGNKLYGVLTEVNPDKNSPILIVTHGFSSSKEGSAKFLSERLNEQNMNTFRFDMFAHGESEGNFEEITLSEGVDDTLKAIEYLKGQGYIKIGLIGNSYSGNTSSLTAAKSNDLFLLVLRSPVSDYEEKERIVNPEELKQWEKNGYKIYTNNAGKKFKINYSFIEDARNNISYDVASQIKIPTLIIHGDKDESVPIEQSIRMSKLIPNCRLEIIEGCDHGYTNPEHREKQFDLITEFVLAHS